MAGDSEIIQLLLTDAFEPGLALLLYSILGIKDAKWCGCYAYKPLQSCSSRPKVYKKTKSAPHFPFLRLIRSLRPEFEKISVESPL